MTGHNTIRRRQNPCCVLEDLLLAKRNQVPLFHSSDHGIDFNSVQSGCAFYCEAVKETDKRRLSVKDR